MPDPLTILVVDDDPSVVTAARGLLSRRGARIEAVFNAMDAIARIRAGGIDAVLMDVWMPEVDGLSALDEIVRLPRAPRVVLMSGDIDARVEAAVQAGKAIASLQKPIDFELANTLLSNTAPARPLDLRPQETGAALGALASQILTRGAAFLEGAPQLPAGTPVSLILEHGGAEPLLLLGVADPTLRAAGKRGLGLKVAPLTSAQQETLRAIQASRGAESAPVVRGQKAQAAEGGNRAQELYQRALERMEQGKYDGALLDLRNASDLAPADPLITAALRRAEQLAGEVRARELFREAGTLAEQKPEEALALLEDAIHLDPTRASYHREAARLYLQNGELEKAETHLGVAVHLAPSDPAPRIHLTQLLERAGRPREALWCCEAALNLFPGDKELLKLAARLMRKVEG